MSDTIKEHQMNRHKVSLLTIALRDEVTQSKKLADVLTQIAILTSTMTTAERERAHRQFSQGEQD